MRLLGRGLDGLRRILNHRVSVAALLEIALWLAVPYLTLGLVWSLGHPDSVQRVQTQLQQQWRIPQGSDYEAAMGAAIVLWPMVLLLPTDACVR